MIHFLETIDASAMKLLSGEAYQISLPSAEVPCTRVSALIVRGGVTVDDALMDRCPNLKVIARCGVGVNNIDVAHASKKGIQVLNVPGVNAATVAEHTIGMMLMLVRGMYKLVEEVKNNNWDYRNIYAGYELRKLKLGIVGMGEIGHRVGAAAGALGMEVSGAGRDAYERLRVLRESDVVSLHLPLTKDTLGMMDEAAFRDMKKGAFLINTARAEIVDTPSLLTALESGHLAGYASDLLPVGEKTVVEKLLQRDKVLVTPHAASLTALTYREMSELTVANVISFLEGKPVVEKYGVNKCTSKIGSGRPMR